MMKENEKKNHEGYPDLTAYEGAKRADGAEAKAYYVMKTICSVARLAGMDVVGTVRLRDRNGKIHDGQLVVWRRDNVVDRQTPEEERGPDNI